MSARAPKWIGRDLADGSATQRGERAQAQKQGGEGTDASDAEDQSDRAAILVGLTRDFDQEAAAHASDDLRVAHDVGIDGRERTEDRVVIASGICGRRQMREGVPTPMHWRRTAKPGTRKIAQTVSQATAAATANQGQRDRRGFAAIEGPAGVMASDGGSVARVCWPTPTRSPGA